MKFVTHQEYAALKKVNYSDNLNELWKMRYSEIAA